MMKRCELCKGRARLQCASDQASLCWACDAKVHSANFLVARHFRNLLCHVCQSPMPWSACGVKLRSTISVCEQCVGRRRRSRGRRNTQSSEEEEEEAEEDEQEEMVEENQAVPWSPPTAEEESTSIGDGEEMISRKRLRIENTSSPDLQLEVQSCASSKLIVSTAPPPDTAEWLCTRRTMLPQKIQRNESGRVETCGSAILNSLRRLHREETGPGGETAEICSLSGPSI